MPYRSQTALKMSSSPATAPVWLSVAERPGSLAPVLTTTMGFPAASAPRGSLHESFRAANALQHAGDHPGVRVVDEKGDVVGDIEVELVAAGYRVAEAEAADSALGEPVLEGSARLEDHAHAAPGKRAHPLRRVEQMGFGQGERAHAVGSADPEPLFAEPGELPGAHAARLVAALAESGGEDQRGLQPVGETVGERVDHALGRDDGKREVDRLGKAREGRVDLAVPETVPAGIDQIDRDRKTGVLQISENRTRPTARAALRSADDGDRPRSEQLID